MNNQTNKSNTKPFLPHLTVAEMKAEHWKKGDIVRLTNGKDYQVISYHSKRPTLYLYSKEYDSRFHANNKIIHKKVRSAKPKAPKTK